LENSKNLSDDNKTVKTGLPKENFTKEIILIPFENSNVFLKKKA
jgi:hypothetical protein